MMIASALCFGQVIFVLICPLSIQFKFKFKISLTFMNKGFPIESMERIIGRILSFFRFAFFLILWKDSFTEIDTSLVTKLKEKSKEVFFVCTFMNNAVRKPLCENNVNFLVDVLLIMRVNLTLLIVFPKMCLLERG